MDLIPHERLLHNLVVSLRKTNSDEQWKTVESTSRELANSLRVRDGPGPSVISLSFFVVT
jgi:hypothetical protein